ncbi:MAG: DinB family protein [Bacteroidota bacterium]
MDIFSFKHRIRQVSDKVQTQFAPLPPSVLGLRPAPTVWSIAENIQHLIIVNNSYRPVFESLHAGTLRLPFIAKINPLVRFMGKSILSSVKPDNKKPIKTFPIWEPEIQEVDQGLLERFEEMQAWLSESLTDLEPIIVQNPVIYSPANKNIVYHLQTAFDIIVSHEERHLAQAQEVAFQLPSNA